MPCTVKSNVKKAPTSTTNMTGFFHWMSGRNMMNDCLSAARTNSGASNPPSDCAAAAVPGVGETVQRVARSRDFQMSS